MPIIAILGGPTASGKSALALRWAGARGLEILSADSRQIYRGFTVGTGAPTAAERAAVPHHLVGHVDPREPFSPGRFRAEAQALVKSHPETRFLVVGGTGLYLKEWLYPSTEERGDTPPEIRAAADREIAQSGLAAVHAGLVHKDPEGMRGVDPRDRYRIQKRLENWLFTGSSYARGGAEKILNPLFEDKNGARVPFLWLDPARAVLHGNIAARVRGMFAQGWAEEVRALLRDYDPGTTPAFNALGYREIAEALGGNPPPSFSETLLETILARTRQYAKKQTTFFRHQFPQARAQNPEALAERLESAQWDIKSLFPEEFVGSGR